MDKLLELGIDSSVILENINRALKRRLHGYEPYAKQKEFHNCKARQRVLSGANRQIALDTPVLTTDGWVEARHITKNHVLFDGDGERTTIDEIMRWDGEESYKMTFADCSSCICDINHYWSAKIGQRHRQSKTRGYERFSMETILKRCGTGNIPSYKRMLIPSPHKIDLPERDLPVDPYLLGHYIGNGWLTPDNSITISANKECYDLLSGLYNTSNHWGGEKFNIKYPGGTKGGYAKAIRAMGLKVGARGKFIPRDYLTSSHKQRKELFMGLMDSDGSCEKDGRVRYWTSSKQLAKDVSELGRSLGCQFKFMTRTTNNNFTKGKDVTSYYVSGRCPHFNPFRLEYRAKNWNDKCQYKGSKLLTNIEPVGKKPGVCFHVKSPLHTFIIKDYIVTGNSGKTYSCCHETAMHCLGIYPDDYEGHKVKPIYDKNLGMDVVYGLVIGTDATSVRDVLQKTLIGTEAMGWNDGMIDKSYTDLDTLVKKRSVSGGAIEQVTIRRAEGGVTILKFRSYAQGRQMLQGFSLDFAHMDEEPLDVGIYGEIQARLADRIKLGNGISYLSFTPLSGLTPLVQQIWKDESDDVELFTMSIYDVKHLDPEEIKKLYKFLPEHEQEARMMGIPSAGSGRVYQFDREEITGYPPYEGKHCDWLGAIDFGRGSHWNVVVYGCVDRRTDVLYITHMIKTKMKTIDQVANLMKRYKPWSPVAYPHDIMRDSGVSRGALGEADRQSEGFKYRELYEREGINMLYEHAKNEEGSLRVEVGITEVRQRIHEGRLKVAAHLTGWFDSAELYRYGEDGKPIKDGKEDEMDATRYLVVSLRYAEKAPSFDEFNLEEGGVYDSTNVFE